MIIIIVSEIFEGMSHQYYVYYIYYVYICYVTEKISGVFEYSCFLSYD